MYQENFVKMNSGYLAFLYMLVCDLFDFTRVEQNMTVKDPIANSI